ncbi:MAG TPA: hypothetical protein VKT28_01735, partial [Puia sp.]|nr:hypothetical protein [Puia sp.]
MAILLWNIIIVIARSEAKLCHFWCSDSPVRWLHQQPNRDTIHKASASLIKICETTCNNRECILFLSVKYP